MKTLFVILSVGLVAMAGCSAKQATRAPERASAEKPYDFEKEGKIPPPDEPAPEPQADFEEIPIDQEEIVGEDVPAPKDTTKAVHGGPKTVEGRDGSINIPVYRVQVLATTSERSALDAKNRVESRLGLAAYVTFEDGMHKVRVGDCRNREEAEKVRTKLRGAGYSDAWIVRDALTVRPETGGTKD